MTVKIGIKFLGFETTTQLYLYQIVYSFEKKISKRRHLMGLKNKRQINSMSEIMKKIKKIKQLIKPHIVCKLSQNRFLSEKSIKYAHKKIYTN